MFLKNGKRKPKDATRKGGREEGVRGKEEKEWGRGKKKG